MNNEFKKYIKLALFDDLDLESTKTAFSMIMSGEIGEIQISSFDLKT